MGLIRKTLAVSTLGGVKFTSRREAETKAHLANARLLQAQARLEAADELAAKWEPIVQAVEAGELCWNDVPKLQRLSMPPKYLVRCLAAERCRTSTPGQHRATTSNGYRNG